MAVGMNIYNDAPSGLYLGVLLIRTRFVFRLRKDLNGDPFADRIVFLYHDEVGRCFKREMAKENILKL